MTSTDSVEQNYWQVLKSRRIEVTCQEKCPIGARFSLLVWLIGNCDLADWQLRLRSEGVIASKVEATYKSQPMVNCWSFFPGKFHQFKFNY